ncbi:tetratricopeptide repeat protein [Mesorhizobium sp.]|jgi:Flp pilus assembly protein TadD|uniref:tetratricopeptide repeat protein n=1 Tax=Mesorhizobium sp. TaxID=1871066 RepID=UPI00120D97B0|nr:tetratricopeptide repeat protein [Mesorhizobium sp.]TIL36791.1 MAG: tetratricopeptide repeat protein [Mesorhizobium sp.]TIL47699.1 MAG: tetratricopeptide repeat protein [Mesorhizobium sp.]TIL50108.1 MAG: tetratricopeptide repeat protein [Mesorhizobium sp.]
MRLHVVFLPVVAMLAVTGCQTTKTDTEQAKAQGPSSQSERLIKLADDIHAQGDSGTAIALYQRAAAMPDAKPSAFVKAGEAYMRAGYPAEAARAYQAALAKAPNDGGAMLGLGSAMMETGDIDAGMRALAQAAPLVNTSSAYIRLGVAQTFAGQTAEAQTTFAQALKLAPGDLDVESNMALAAALEGNSATALPLVQKISAAPDAQLHHKRNVVVVYGLLGQADQVRASPPIGLATKEVNTLLARARTIRSKGSTQARAKALGSILG